MDNRLTWRKRFFMIIGVVVLHGLCYQAVNILNSHKPLSAFVNFHMVVDDWIPYIPLTLFFYYLGDAYILFFAPIVVWKLSDKKFIRAVGVYAGMIISGALIQLAFPCQAPWPNHLASIQMFVHKQAFLRPYACLPSMHVALTVLPACILFWVTRSCWLRASSTMVAFLITVSIVTAKEHYFLDAVTGIAFALVFYVLWRSGFKIHLIKRLGNKDGNPKRETV